MTKQSIILGIGTGRCGTASLAKILNQQPDTVCSFDEPPLLPWKTGGKPSPPAPLPKGEGRFEDGTLARVGNRPSPPAPLPQADEGSFFDNTVQQAGEGSFFDNTVQQAGEGSFLDNTVQQAGEGE